MLLVLHYDPVTYLSASKHIFKIIEAFLPLVFMYSQFYPAYIKAFGGLGVACWPLVPKFTGSNPAEAV